MGNQLEAEAAARCKGLAIPPAWTDVWICPFPNGHLQSVGRDSAGRLQYIYHPDWERRRADEKHSRVLQIARRLPEARATVQESLSATELTEKRTLAVAFRLLDLGYFRMGSDTYTDQNGSFGLTTILRSHVHRRGRYTVFEFPAKSGVTQHIEILDPDVATALQIMLARRGGDRTLLAYKDGRHWKRVAPDQLNAYLKELLCTEVTAKDFRTWHGTVHAAVSLAGRPAHSKSERRKAVTQAMRDVADHLGNTPSIARASYVDKRVIERYYEGATIAAAVRRSEKPGVSERAKREIVERATLNLLSRR